MNEQTKLALINFTGFVATAIARQANEKFVDWREIVDAQEALKSALQNDQENPPVANPEITAALDAQPSAD